MERLIFGILRYVLPNPGLRLFGRRSPGTSNKLTADLDVDALRNRLGIWVNAILQQLHSSSFDSDSHDSVFYGVENRLELY